MLSMMPATEKLLPANYRGGPYVMFHTFFPRAGLYKIWAQFKRAGRIITAPFVLRVDEAQTWGGRPAPPASSHGSRCPTERGRDARAPHP